MSVIYLVSSQFSSYYIAENRLYDNVCLAISFKTMYPQGDNRRSLSLFFYILGLLYYKGIVGYVFHERESLCECSVTIHLTTLQKPVPVKPNGHVMPYNACHNNKPESFHNSSTTWQIPPDIISVREKICSPQVNIRAVSHIMV